GGEKEGSCEKESRPRGTVAGLREVRGAVSRSEVRCHGAMSGLPENDRRSCSHPDVGERLARFVPQLAGARQRGGVLGGAFWNAENVDGGAARAVALDGDLLDAGRGELGLEVAGEADGGALQDLVDRGVADVLQVHDVGQRQLGEDALAGG